MTLESKIMADARSGHACIRCKREDGTVCGRHYNGQRQHLYGKGRGIKGHPFLVADLCFECDKLFQEGSVGKLELTERDSYSEAFLHECVMSLIRREQNGVIK